MFLEKKKTMTMTKIPSRKPSGTYGHGPLINIFHIYWVRWCRFSSQPILQRVFGRHYTIWIHSTELASCHGDMAGQTMHYESHLPRTSPLRAWEWRKEANPHQHFNLSMFHMGRLLVFPILHSARAQSPPTPVTTQHLDLFALEIQCDRNLIHF